MRWNELEEGDVAHSASESFVLVKQQTPQLWLCLDNGQAFEVQGSTAEVASWWRIDRKRK